MTEQEWQVCTDFNAMMLLFVAWETYALPREAFTMVPKVVRDRKYRLFACACARRTAHLIDDERPLRALEVAERYADGLADHKELLRAYSCAQRFNMKQLNQRQGASRYSANPGTGAAFSVRRESLFEAFSAAGATPDAAVLALASSAKEAAKKAGLPEAEAIERFNAVERAEKAFQANLLRDIFNNPFRSLPAFHVSWRTRSVLALAQEIYERKAFERLPALADLLQGEGCETSELLEHLRRIGSHVRGCWALDLILGKT